MKPLNSENIFGSWATLLLPYNKNSSIDFAALAHQIDMLIDMRPNGIYTNGSAGEFYNQTEAEFDQIHLLLFEKCERAGMPFQIGCSHMSPKLSLERTQRAVQLQPGAIQVILPDWVPPSFSEIVKFLAGIADTAGDTGLVLYNPPHAKIQLSPQDYQRIKQQGIPLVGCKTAGGNEQWYREMAAIPDLSVFVPGTKMVTGIRQGASGAYSNIACLHPGVARHWYDQVATDFEKAIALEERIVRFIITDVIPLSAKGYADTALDKMLASLTNWAGCRLQVRWPYDTIPDDEVAAIRKKCRAQLPEFFSCSTL